MRDLVILLVHLITTIFRLAKPGGLRAVVAESILAKHQLLILNRSRKRSPVGGEFPKITRRWESDRGRDSAAATGRKKSVMAPAPLQDLAVVLPSPSAHVVD